MSRHLVFPHHNKISDRGLERFFSLHGTSPSRFLLGVVVSLKESKACAKALLVTRYFAQQSGLIEIKEKIEGPGEKWLLFPMR